MKLSKIFFVFFLFSTTAYADTYTVTSLDDSGPGTLRAIMSNVADIDDINFDGSLSGTILLQSSLPDITINYFTIVGPDDKSISIDGNSQYRIFNVLASPFFVTNLNLINGADASQGGAMHVGSGKHAYLVDVVITPASGSTGNNPLFAEEDGILDLTDVIFTSANASQIYLNAGSMNITSNIPLEFVIDGVGGGQVYKYGEASTEIFTPLSTTSSYFINIIEGLVSFSGSIADGITVIYDGTLQGTFGAGEVVSIGTVQPGNPFTFGTVSLSGNYAEVLGDTQIKVDPSGNVDLIQADSYASIFGGTLTIIPASGTYLTGTKYTLLTAGIAVHGTFTSVFSGELNVQINYHANSIEIEILGTQTI